MSVPVNPARVAFVTLIQNELVWAQIVIRPCGSGYEIRHVADQCCAADKLRVLPLSEVRQLAHFTSAGAFRPLKSAPNLPSGWRITLRDAEELQLAVDRLYPGSIADWYATRSLPAPVTHYRQFADRQTGMYRITAKLNDAQAAQVIKACCHESVCLKRRFWSVTGLEADASGIKSAIPCLEPCAILLECARKAVRLDQEEKVNLPVGSSELMTLVAAFEGALRPAEYVAREGDLEAPANPRRLRLLLEKIRVKVAATAKSQPE